MKISITQSPVLFIRVLIGNETRCNICRATLSNKEKILTNFNSTSLIWNNLYLCIYWNDFPSQIFPFYTWNFMPRRRHLEFGIFYPRSHSTVSNPPPFIPSQNAMSVEIYENIVSTILSEKAFRHRKLK